MLANYKVELEQGYYSQVPFLTLLKCVAVSNGKQPHIMKQRFDDVKSPEDVQHTDFTNIDKIRENKTKAMTKRFYPTKITTNSYMNCQSRIRPPSYPFSFIVMQ